MSKRGQGMDSDLDDNLRLVKEGPWMGSYDIPCGNLLFERFEGGL